MEESSNKLITFRSNSTLLTSKMISKILANGEEHTSIQFVKIKVLPLSFLYPNDGWFGECVKSIKESECESIFGHKIMRALFNSYFSECRSAIVKAGFVPYLVYFITTLTFNFYQVQSVFNQMGYGMTEPMFWTCCPILIITWAYFTYQELLQFKDIWKRKHQENKRCKRLLKTIKSYISSGYNVLDVALIFGQPLNLLATEIHYLAVHGSYIWSDSDKGFSPFIFFGFVFFIQTAMWSKLADWLRLFTKTAVYPSLLKAVMIDVTPYMLMMLIIFGFFGNGFYIFHSYAKYKGVNSMGSVDEDVGYGFFPAVLSEILIMVGEFHYMDYNENGVSIQFQIVLWIWFILALVITQIVFLNTLIAIISETFERVWDQRKQIIISSQADLLCDWLSLRKMMRGSQDNNEQFLFLVEPQKTLSHRES